MILFTKERDRFVDKCYILYAFWEIFLSREQYVKRMIKDSFKFVHIDYYSALHLYGYSVYKPCPDSLTNILNTPTESISVNYI